MKTKITFLTAAFIAAKDSGAAQTVPNLYRKAEYFYLKAKSAYRRKYFNKAQQYANISREYSEKAEFASRRKKTLESL